MKSSQLHQVTQPHLDPTVLPPGAEMAHSATLPASVDGEAFAGEELVQEVARVKEEDNSAPA